MFDDLSFTNWEKMGKHCNKLYLNILNRKFTFYIYRHIECSRRASNHKYFKLEITADVRLNDKQNIRQRPYIYLSLLVYSLNSQNCNKQY